ncbi:hypothetical protein MMPV_004277 [Pyropia vietnamensis]
MPIATWPFGATAVATAAAAVAAGAAALAATAAGVTAVEHDPSVTSVGYGGLPRADGSLSLDAALMGADGTLGAVAAVPGVRAAMPLAAALAAEGGSKGVAGAPPPILVGAGALAWAVDAGLAGGKDGRGGEVTLTPHARRRWEAHVAAPATAAAGRRAHATGLQGLGGPVEESPLSDGGRGDPRVGSNSGGSDGGDGGNGGGGCDHGGPPPPMDHTDTVGLIVRDADGGLAVGTATSGAEFALPGRVGDAPVVGAGFYASADGAAAVTGDGDRLLRHLLAAGVVSRLAAGVPVADAVRGVVAALAAADPAAAAAVVAMDAGG